MSYDVQATEKKWREIWEFNPIKTKATGKGKRYYCLDMFPYPSGSGLHVGHWRGYVLSDVYSRIKVLEGYNVLHPMGWDAFGLPAENDAIKKGIHPKTNTAQNIANFKNQLKKIAAIYDWSKELNTTDPDYYKWTQWIFLQMYKAGLAYESHMPINWCPSCLTGLANEEVVDGTCERCGASVEQKDIRQWVLKITDYAQKLLDGLDKLDWPEKVKTMQRNWIGRSQGLEIFFALDANDIRLPVYTTAPETIFGVSFLVIAPDHELVEKIITPEQKKEVEAYQQKTNLLSSMDRKLDKEKTGVFSGSYAINPATQELIPIYLASYVLKDYGTGIVMGVPAHDGRDFEFAKKYNLPRKQVIFSDTSLLDVDNNIINVYEGDGSLINSKQFDALPAKKTGKEKISLWLIEQKIAQQKVQYKLRDWIFSRQRYWGEPIPLIHCQTCGIVPVPEDQLPVELPEVKQYEPTGTGESPLAAIEDWINTPCPKCDDPAKRESNTMPQWAGSCWYFLRYPNPHLKDKPWSKQDMQYWLPVDLYVGGIEHAILHLLYARFYVKVLHDLGYLPFDEPFTHLFNQGMILRLSEKSGQVEKMSKSKGNVVNPDDIVDEYGSDVLRMYILFMGPPELDAEWQDKGLEGIKRFLNRFWNYATDKNNSCSEKEETEQVKKRVHKCIHDFQDRLHHFKPNTAISALMEWLNDVHAQKMKLSLDSLEKITILLSVMAPHMASDILLNVCKKELKDCVWPTYDPELLQEDTATIVVQVNGKLRANIQVPRDALQEIAEPQARHAIEKWLADKNIIKIIFVKNRLINFVVK